MHILITTVSPIHDRFDKYRLCSSWNQEFPIQALELVTLKNHYGQLLSNWGQALCLLTVNKLVFVTTLGTSFVSFDWG